MIVFQDKKSVRKSRLEKEFEKDLDKELQVLVSTIGAYMYVYHMSYVIVTHIKRTQAKQDEIYKNFPIKSVRERYLRNPWKSLHQLKRHKGGIRAVDIITPAFASVKEELTDWINEHFKYGKGRFLTAVPEGVKQGFGNCIHLQVK